YDIDAASVNIRRMTRYGRENRAVGLLNTDWGDCGHVNLLSGSYHGMALGAALSWNGASYPEEWQFDASVSAVEWGDRSGKVARSLRELGSLCSYHFGNMYAWVNGISGTWNREREVEEMDGALIEKNHLRATAIFNVFNDLKASGKLCGNVQDLDEFIWSAAAVRWTLGLIAFKKRNEYNNLECMKIYESKEQLLEEGASLLQRFEMLWRERNRESELRNVKETFSRIFARVERMPDG
ncbi:MAG: hypothetical protein JW768_03235, partial [Chitinispirillaceae bacterium]|nr:hypothetical protein [Chitinispirillaceae bacterium]